MSIVELSKLEKDEPLIVPPDSLEVRLWARENVHTILTNWGAKNTAFAFSLWIHPHRTVVSHHHNQCLWIIWWSEDGHHQVAHICPGEWRQDNTHGVELLEQFSDSIWYFLHYWRSKKIEKFYIFGGKISEKEEDIDGYYRAREIIWHLLWKIFWDIPHIELAGPSMGEEHQHVIVWPDSIRHFRTPNITRIQQQRLPFILKIRGLLNARK